MSGPAESLGLVADMDGPQGHKLRVMAELARHPFRVPWWLRNNHVQTIVAARFRVVKHPPLRLERWDTPDGDFLRLHFQDGEPGRPIVLLLTGLEGSVRSKYISGMNHLIGEAGWNAVTMEHRSCGGELNRTKRMYDSAATDDLDFAVRRLIERHPETRIYVAGFSLGGNVATKWLGELGAGVPENVRAAAAVSAPFNMVETRRIMDRSRRWPYVKNFLKTLIPKILEKERQFPGSVDVEALKRSRTFFEFDTHATAALHGYKGAHDYYAKAGCGQFLAGIRRPTLLLSAADDPFNPGTALPRELAGESPFLHPQFTAHGGHVAHIYGPFPGLTRYWSEEQTLRFFLAYDRLL